MYRYADLCALTGGMENEKKANDAYKFVAEALPDRFTYVFKYALQKIGLEDSDTMEWLDKCQKLSFDEKSLVQVLNIKSTLARHHQKDYIKALSMTSTHWKYCPTKYFHAFGRLLCYLPSDVLFNGKDIRSHERIQRSKGNL